MVQLVSLEQNRGHREWTRARARSLTHTGGVWSTSVPLGVGRSLVAYLRVSLFPLATTVYSVHSSHCLGSIGLCIHLVVFFILELIHLASHATPQFGCVCNCLQESSQSFSSSWCHNLACAVLCPCFALLHSIHVTTFVHPERPSCLPKGGKGCQVSFLASPPPELSHISGSVGGCWGSIVLLPRISEFISSG